MDQLAAWAGSTYGGILTGIVAAYVYKKLVHDAPYTNVDPNEMKVIIVGAGFSGLCAAIKLKLKGIPFIVLEKAPRVGGTWWFNRYPGCACDIPSHLYSYSFEQKADWSCSYPSAPEIQDYLEHCAKKYDLYPHIKFNTEVVETRWDEAASSWFVKTKEKVYQGRILISGIGGLHVANFPNIKGRDSFKGPNFHSSYWDRNFDWKDKRVAIIGSAASAIQIVPEMAETTKEMYIYQRTPNWISPKEEYLFPGWAKFLFRYVPFIIKLFRWFLYWRQEVLYWALFNPTKRPLQAKVAREGMILHIKSQIKDPQLQEKLIPNYALGCKRLLIHNKYYPALNQPNVHLITSPITEIHEDGVETKEGKVEVDALIYATGFNPGAIGLSHIYGTNGKDLAEEWKHAGHAYLGISIPNFPNLFILLGPNTALGHNSVVWMIECQVEYQVQCIEEMIKKKYKRVEVKEEAMKEDLRWIKERLTETVWLTGGCNSWYKNGDDVFTVFPGHTFEYWWRTKTPRVQDYFWK